MAREKCGLLAVPRTVLGSRDVLPLHSACPSFSLQPAEAHSCYDCTCKVLGTLRTTATLVRVLCSLIEWLYVTQMLIRCYVQLLTLQKPHIPASFNMYLVINKCVTAAILSNFSLYYLHNLSTMDMGVLGYIGVF